eukprot:2503266-Lingulodinium_polyedra.AAC.1
MRIQDHGQLLAHYVQITEELLQARQRELRNVLVKHELFLELSALTDPGHEYHSSLVIHTLSLPLRRPGNALRACHVQLRSLHLASGAVFCTLHPLSHDRRIGEDPAHVLEG